MSYEDDLSTFTWKGQGRKWSLTI